MDIDKLGPTEPIPHYYGDFVRTLFLTGGFIMLVTLPFFQNSIPFPLSVSICAILLVNVLAGLTSPRHLWVNIFNTVSAIIAFLVFEYLAVTKFNETPNYFALINQLLALIFFVASYYTTKTLRWSLTNKKEN